MSADPNSAVADMDCNNLFDRIDDFLEFPEDISKTSNNTTFSGVWNASFPHSLLNLDSDFKEMVNGCSPDLAAELSIPYEDIAQMEWLSVFMEDSFGAGNTMTLDKREFPVANNGVVAAGAGVTPIQFHSSSPMSVLESSSSSSTSSSSESGKFLLLSPDNARKRGACGRARSKRPRPPTFNPGSAMQLISPAQSLIDTRGACGEELNDSPFLKKVSDVAGQNKTKRSSKSSRQVEPSRDESGGEPAATESQAGVRKCLHCEITKTPQWRAGPLGPKTLCNACGVRYKSGRLFPEYRPAASPTFVPSLHSNSHKKVIEMRTTTTLDTPSTTMSEVIKSDDAQPEFIPNKDALLDYM